MALPLANTFEGGSNGTAITTVNSGGTSGDAFTTVAGSAPAPAFSNAAAMHGGLSYVVAQPASPGVCFCEWGSTVIPTSGHLYGRSYFRLSTLVAAALVRLVQFSNNANLAAAISLTSAGAIQWLAGAAGNSSSGTLSSALTINTWYRLEWDITFSSSPAAIMTCNIYTGDSTTLLTSASASGVTSGGNAVVNLMRIGSVSGGGANVSYFFDDIQLNATGLPGSSFIPQPQRPTIVSQAVNRAATFMKSRQFEAQRFRPVFARA